MAQIDSQTLQRNIEKGNLDPIYFLFGEENYLVEQALEAIKAKALDGALADFNYNLFYAADCDVSAVRDAVETLPMMSPRRLVILKQAQALTDKEWEELEKVIDQPVDSTVFVIQADRIDKRKKAIKNALENSTHVEFKRPFENQIPQWIRLIAKNHDISLSDEAVEFMRRMLGAQLRDIDAEMLKLVNYLGGRKAAELADVAQVISRSREDSVFEFTEAIGRKDRITALYTLVKLLDQGQSEIGLVSLVSRHVRILLLIHQGFKEGLSGQKLAAFAGVSPFFLSQYQDQARLWTVKRLEDTLLVLADTDKGLKSSPLSSHIWLENLILKVTQGDS